MHFFHHNFILSRLFIAIILCLSVFCSGIALAKTVTQEPVTLSFGVVPQQSATKLAVKWGPVLKYLSDKTGYQIQFQTAKDIPTFEKRCGTGEYDIAYMNPYHYIHFHDTPGYNVFAREQLKSLQGILVVKKDSPQQSLKAFAGKTLAFPSPAAFAASIITRAHLSDLGVPFTPKYVSSHDSVYRGVAKGLFPGGGGIPRTFNNLDKETKDQLQILWTSKKFTPHAFAAHPRISEETVTTLKNAMVHMWDDPEGSSLLTKLSIKGFIADKDNTWNDIRELKISLLLEEDSSDK